MLDRLIQLLGFLDYSKEYKRDFNYIFIHFNYGKSSIIKLLLFINGNTSRHTFDLNSKECDSKIDSFIAFFDDLIEN